MSTKPNLPNPKLIFDAALADLDNNGSRRNRAGALALERARPLRARTESMGLKRERALNEAANALAKLWKR